MIADMSKIVSLCKRRGFIFPSSEIYGGLASSWDYGPLGVELKKNVKDAWWKSVVYERDDVFGMDAAILMHPKVWKASGHLDNFSDYYVDCKDCKKRFKADTIKGIEIISGEKPAYKVTPLAKCPNCAKNNFTDARPFNLMFETHQGPIADQSNRIYLRPETAQGMFVNFANVLNTKHPKLPFGLAQIGKSFRNEITPGNFTFRSREFEQMEIEYFVDPGEDKKYYEYWVDERFNWYLRLGMKKENLRIRPHAQDELAHYAEACSDIEYNFPFGWMELEGIANRTDFDLKQHIAESGTDLAYFNEEKKEKIIPYIIEPSGGVDRSLLAFLVDAYREEVIKGEKRVVLSLHKTLAPFKIAVFPLLRNRPEIVEMARKITKDLSKNFVVTYDDTAGIGRLYRRQDEIGTFYCITVDVKSLEDNQATVRDRDTMVQERISLDKLKEYLLEKLSN